MDFEPGGVAPAELELVADPSIGKYEALQLAVGLLDGRDFETPNGDQSIYDLVDVAIKCAERFLEWIDEE
jgi:hypothetical protein